MASAALLAVLGGCAGQSGVSNIGPSNIGHAPLKPEMGLLSQPELQANCPQIATAMAARAQTIKKLRASMKTELEKPAPTLERMFQRAKGAEGLGTVNFDMIQQERRTMTALNAQLSKKGCPEINIDTAIAVANDPTPAPDKTPPAKPPKSRAG